VLAGRVVEQAWLAMTAQGMAVQPMMSVAILENSLRYGSPKLLAALGEEQTLTVTSDFRQCVCEAGDDRLAFLMRFGYAPSPSVRTGRLPLHGCTTCSPQIAAPLGRSLPS
jgi:hypothetical protein